MVDFFKIVQFHHSEGHAPKKMGWNFTWSWLFVLPYMKPTLYTQQPCAKQIKLEGSHCYRVFFNDWVKVWALYSGQNTSWELGEVYFFQLGHNILKLCFEKIQGFSYIFQILMEFEAQILKICKIHRKSRIRQTTVLFCKYLANESSDLHEILCGGQLLSCELKFKISWRSMFKCSHSRYNVHARIYNLYTIISSSNSRRTEIEEMTIRWTEA